MSARSVSLVTYAKVAQCLKLYGYSIGDYRSGFFRGEIADASLLKESLQRCQVRAAIFYGIEPRMAFFVLNYEAGALGWVSCFAPDEAHCGCTLLSPRPLSPAALTVKLSFF